MATKKSKVDTSALFRGLVGRGETEQTKVENEPNEPLVCEAKDPDKVSFPTEPERESVKVGRKANKEKNIQVSIYLTPNQAKELRVQDALKEKETDKSAIARMGIDIALALSKETYAAMKAEAGRQGKTPGEVVQEALERYL